MPTFETRREATLRLLKDERSWPCWPYLPMRNPERRDQNGFPALGFLTCTVTPLTARVTITLYLGVMPLLSSRTQRDEEAEHYSGIQSMLDAGWEVD